MLPGYYFHKRLSSKSSFFSKKRATLPSSPRSLSVLKYRQNSGLSSVNFPTIKFNKITLDLGSSIQILNQTCYYLYPLTHLTLVSDILRQKRTRALSSSGLLNTYLTSNTFRFNVYRCMIPTIGQWTEQGVQSAHNASVTSSLTDYSVSSTGDCILHSWTLMNFVNLAYTFSSKKLLLGIYMTNSSYFLNNDVYFPSPDNVRVFVNNCIVNLKDATTIHLISGGKKFFPKYSNYEGGMKRLTQGLSLLWQYKLLGSRLKRLSTSLSFTGRVKTWSSVLYGPKFSYCFFKFFRKKYLLNGKNFLSYLLRLSVKLKETRRASKTFKFLRTRLKYFSQFDSIYNPNSIGVQGGKYKMLSTKSYLSMGNSAKRYPTRAVFKLPIGTLSWFQSLKYVTFFKAHFAPFLLKLSYFFSNYPCVLTKSIGLNSNLIPDYTHFHYKLNKHMHSARLNYSFRENVTPWVYSTLIRFIEHLSGKKVCLDIYSFMSQSIDLNYITLYKSWLSRFSYYERRLGHRFFLEEALHILHMGFNYQDSKLISSWLKAIIQRISFWKTRFIFRFIRYLFNNYFQYMFKELGVKGFKLRLKGKISVAGNSRKRSILYRIGKTSHTTVGLKVVHTMDTIVTFTGVMGFQVWIFY